MVKVKIPTEIFTEIDIQVGKFTFKSSRLRNLIKYQLKSSKGQAASLNTVRHYINSKGECPYEMLWKPLEPIVHRECDFLRLQGREKEAIKLRRKVYDIYRNKINEKIYSYTVKMLYKQLH